MSYRRDKITALAAQGHTCAEIARMTGVTRQRVHQLLRVLNVSARNGRHGQRNPERIGARANNRTVLRREGELYVVRCDACFTEVTLSWVAFRSHGCAVCRKLKAHALPQSAVGEQYGRWTVLHDPGGLSQRLVTAQCACGATHRVILRNMAVGMSSQCQKCGWAKRGTFSLDAR